jgi:hypothetical protein
MFSFLRTLAARVRWPFFGGLPPAPFDDPYAGVRQPRRRGPTGKITAVALDEPVEQKGVHAGYERNKRHYAEE